MANMKLYKVASIVSILSLVGCGKGGFLFGGQTDPLSGKEKVQNGGAAKPTPDEKPPGVDPNAIVVDVVDAYSFNLNQPGEIEINGRVLLKDFTKRIDIQNLGEFPGATYDAKAGLFKWTPPSQIFTGTEKTWRAGLIVRVTAIDPKQAIYIKEKTINVSVDKIASPLKVISFEPTNKKDFIYEFSSLNLYEVVIEDSNATVNPDSWPVIEFEPSNGLFNSLATFARVTKTDSLGGGRYKVTILLEPNQDLTKNKTRYSLALHANSALGLRSPSVSKYIDVLNKLTGSKTSWIDAITFYTGQKNSYSFVYFNPKEEGFIQDPVFSGKPAGLNIKCSNSGGWTNPCFVDWDLTAATASMPGDYSVRGSLDTFNAMGDPTGKTVDAFTHKIKVLQGPAPSPEGVE